MGSKYEAVFPLPVTEWASTSCPSKIAGITILYMIVGCSYCKSVHALTRGFDKLNSVNYIKSSLS